MQLKLKLLVLQNLLLIRIIQIHFNPTTTINFSLAEPTFVKLAIYNLLGEEVEVLKNENMNAGSFNVSFDASSLPSGMYLYKVETAQFSSVRKMMLMK